MPSHTHKKWSFRIHKKSYGPAFSKRIPFILCLFVRVNTRSRHYFTGSFLHLPRYFIIQYIDKALTRFYGIAICLHTKYKSFETWIRSEIPWTWCSIKQSRRPWYIHIHRIWTNQAAAITLTFLSGAKYSFCLRPSWTSSEPLCGWSRQVTYPLSISCRWIGK